MAQGQIIRNDLTVLGEVQVQDELSLGHVTFAGSIREVRALGSATNIDILLNPKGIGTVKVPVGYTANIADNDDIINLDYFKTNVVTKPASSLLQAPTATEDQYGITYDHANNRFTLAPTGAALTFDNGLTKITNNVRLGGPLLTDTTITGAFDLNIGTIGSQLDNVNIHTSQGVDIRGLAHGRVRINGTNGQIWLYGGIVDSYLLINDDGAIIVADLQTGAAQRGIRGSANYSANYQANDYIQKIYADSKIVSRNISASLASPGAGQNGYAITWDHANSRFTLSLAGGGGGGGAGAWSLANGGTLTGNNTITMGANEVTFTGNRVRFTPNATTPGINVGVFAGNPSSLAVGDLWFSSTQNLLWTRKASSTHYFVLSQNGGQANRIPVFTDTDNISGTANFTYNNTTLLVGGTAPTASTTLDIRGPGTTAGTFGLRVANSANVTRLTLDDEGTLNLSTTATTHTWTGTTYQGWSSLIGAGGGANIQVGQVISIAGGTNPFRFDLNSVPTGGTAMEIRETSSDTNIGGANSGAFIKTKGGFTRNAGTNTHTHLQLNPTYNTTGTYSGTVIGIDYNPTLTSTTGLTHLAWRNTSGSVLIGGTTLTTGDVLVDLQSTSRALVITRFAGDVVTPVDGMLHYNTTSNTFRFRQNGAWVSLGGGSAVGAVNELQASDGAGAFISAQSTLVSGVLTLGLTTTATTTHTLSNASSSGGQIILQLVGRNSTTGSAAGGRINIIGGNGGATSGSGGPIFLTGGNAGGTSGVGGAITLTSGNGAVTGSGGAISLLGGVGGTTSGAGGAINLTGGNATAGNSLGGSITLTGGSSTGSSVSGGVSLFGGNSLGTGNGGAINITAGSAGATTGEGGSIALLAGAGGGTSGAGGSINITGGPANGTNSNGGNISITSGTPTGSGTPGNINISATASEGTSTAGGQVNIFSGGANSNGAGGRLRITAGSSIGTGAGGELLLESGVGGGAGGNAGALNIKAGDAQFGNTNGGTITLTSGNRSGSGTFGNIVFVTNSTTRLSIDGLTGRSTFATGDNGSLVVGTHTADHTAPVNGLIMYNTTSNTFRFRQNGAWVGLGGGGGGITNSAAADEIMVSDGTNAIGRKVFSTSNGNLRLGDTGLAGSRNIQVESSDANSDLILSSKGIGALNFRHGTFSASRLTTDGIAVINSIGKGGDYLRLRGDAGTSSVVGSSTLALGSLDDIIIQPANDLLFATSLGNIKLWDTDGSVGGGSKVILIGNAATNPTTNPLNAGILYADASDGSKLKWRVPSGTVFDLTATGAGGGITNSAVNNELMKSDGTNAIGSGILSTVEGHIIMGLASTAGAARTFTANGSEAHVSISFSGKGNGSLAFLSGGSIRFLIANNQIGFFGATAAHQQGPVTTAQGIADALTAYGLLQTSTISGSTSRPSVTTVSSDTTISITGSEQIVRGDTTSSNVTTTLPTASGITGHIIILKRISAGTNTWTIDANSTETIDGDLTAVLTTQYESITIFSNGTNWEII